MIHDRVENDTCDRVVIFNNGKNASNLNDYVDQVNGCLDYMKVIFKKYIKYFFFFF